MPHNSHPAGHVFRVREKASRRVLVLKVIDKAAILDEGVRPQLQREVEVHTRLVHANVVRMYAYFHDADRGEWAQACGMTSLAHSMRLLPCVEWRGT
jgi:serine/threonine protein kinase